MKSFQMKNKIDEQAYRLILFNIYCIHNIFHKIFLKFYLHRADDLKAETMMQISKLVDDTEQWKVKKIMNKIKSKKKI